MSHPIRPLTSLQSAVFLINSCSQLVTATLRCLRSKSFTAKSVPSPEVTVLFCLVPSAEFSQAPWYALPDHLCRFRVRSLLELFPGTTPPHTQSNKWVRVKPSVTSSWCRNIYLLPIDYAFQPRLRGRLTLRRLALRRNPWSFGESVSHTLIVTHVSILTSDTSSQAHA